MKTPLISRAYRIKKEQDIAIKRKAKKEKIGENEIVRQGIDMAVSEYLKLDKIN